MKFAILGIFVSLLSGCGNPPTTMMKAKQDFACKDVGGVYKYRDPWYESVQCRNGELLKWKGVVLSEQFYPEPEKKEMVIE